MEYVWVRGNEKTIEAKVSEYLEKGWVPIGGPVATKMWPVRKNGPEVQYFAQAMTRGGKKNSKELGIISYRGVVGPDEQDKKSLDKYGIYFPEDSGLILDLQAGEPPEDGGTEVAFLISDVITQEKETIWIELMVLVRFG